MLILTKHALQRMALRQLREEAISYVVTYGQCFHAAGAKICYLRGVDIPVWDRANDKWAKLVGTAVILTKDGRTIITAWRNRRNGLKRIKRKPDYFITKPDWDGWLLPNLQKSKIK